MRIASVQFTPWDKIYYFNSKDINLVLGDKVIVKTEMGTELGAVVQLVDLKDSKVEEFIKSKTEKNTNNEVSEEKSDEETRTPDTDQAETEDTGEVKEAKEQSEDQTLIKPILRRATIVDLEKQVSKEEKAKAIKACKQFIDKHKLPMKLVDIHYAFDGSRITFAFIADGRVDFRELVKDLTRQFNRTIRLQQIGIRDEAKIMGDYGHCGRGLCCRGHLKSLQSITSEMAEIQQCAHRGSERISGVCGRLMCCLAYEQLGYEELKAKMPETGTKVRVDEKRGEIVGQHILKQTVDVKFKNENGEDNTVVEVDLNRRK